jgi:hypothetical protein
MPSNTNDIERAVARALRDSLEKLQHTSDEVSQAVGDLVSACASARPSNALPHLVRAQTAAASLAASLDVLSRFITGALQPGWNAGFGQSNASEPGEDEDRDEPPYNYIQNQTQTEPSDAAQFENIVTATAATVGELICSEKSSEIPSEIPEVQAKQISATEATQERQDIPRALPEPPAEIIPQEPRIPETAAEVPISVSEIVEQSGEVSTTHLAESFAEIAQATSEIPQIPEPAPEQIAETLQTVVAETAAAETAAVEGRNVKSSDTSAEVAPPFAIPSPSFNIPPATIQPPSQPEHQTTETAELPKFDVAALPTEQQELHRRANRVAKVTMQDIKMLRPRDVEQGKQNHDLCTRLRDDIERAHKEYERRFQAILDHPVDYFHAWMVEILADGEPRALGEYPYRSPVLHR